MSFNMETLTTPPAGMHWRFTRARVLNSSKNPREVVNDYYPGMIYSDFLFVLELVGYVKATEYSVTSHTTEKVVEYRNWYGAKKTRIRDVKVRNEVHVGDDVEKVFAYENLYNTKNSKDVLPLPYVNRFGGRDKLDYRHDVEVWYSVQPLTDENLASISKGIVERYERSVARKVCEAKEEADRIKAANAETEKINNYRRRGLDLLAANVKD